MHPKSVFLTSPLKTSSIKNRNNWTWLKLYNFELGICATSPCRIRLAHQILQFLKLRLHVLKQTASSSPTVYRISSFCEVRPSGKVKLLMTLNDLFSLSFVSKFTQEILYFRNSWSHSRNLVNISWFLIKALNHFLVDRFRLTCTYSNESKLSLTFI